MSEKNVKKENKNRTRAFILYFVLVIFILGPVEGLCHKPKYRANIIHPSIFVSSLSLYFSFSHFSCPKDPVYCFISYVTIVILTLTSPIDINAPTRDALVLVTKDSFVSLVINLNKKNDDCKQ